jgi:flagellar secretion chaperone FliS
VSRANQYAAAKLAYTEASVMTASPEKLVIMLYDGAIRFLTQAAAALRAGALTQSRDRVRRGQAVIEELNRSLDLSQGEVAVRLRSIYGFCTRHLIESTAQSDPDGYEQVVELLAGLRESWAEIAATAEQVPA